MGNSKSFKFIFFIILVSGFSLCYINLDYISDLTKKAYINLFKNFKDSYCQEVVNKYIIKKYVKICFTFLVYLSSIFDVILILSIYYNKFSYFPLGSEIPELDWSLFFVILFSIFNTLGNFLSWDCSYGIPEFGILYQDSNLVLTKISEIPIVLGNLDYKLVSPFINSLKDIFSKKSYKTDLIFSEDLIYSIFELVHLYLKYHSLLCYRFDPTKKYKGLLIYCITALYCIVCMFPRLNYSIIRILLSKSIIGSIVLQKFGITLFIIFCISQFLTILYRIFYSQLYIDIQKNLKKYILILKGLTELKILYQILF
jgi:hypothetical protein